MYKSKCSGEGHTRQHLLPSDRYKFLFLLAHSTIMKPKTLCQLFCLLWHSLVASATAMWMPSYLNYACLYALRHPKIARLQSEVQPPSQPQQSLQRYLRVSRPFILKIYISLPKKNIFGAWDHLDVQKTETVSYNLILILTVLVLSRKQKTQLFILSLGFYKDSARI